MANLVCDVLLTQAVLEMDGDSSGASGAIVDFWGTVRALEEGQEIEGIEYEAHQEMADHQLRLIARAAAERFGLESVIVHHRLGFVAVTEASVYVRVVCQNREQAFQASQWTMNELKRKVPIWKRPKFKVANERQPQLAHIEE